MYEIMVKCSNNLIYLECFSKIIDEYRINAYYI